MAQLLQIAPETADDSLDCTSCGGSAVDTLRGSLETFGLDGVMNLITSAGKTGVLKAFSGRLVGRIYFRDGAIVYGTTREPDGYVTDLYQRQSAGSAEGREHERRGRTQTNEWKHPLEELVKHQIVDVFVRLLQIPGGQFAFEEGTTTSAYQAEAEHRFDPAMISELAKERLAEWDGIVALVPSPTARFRLADTLPPDQFDVTIDAKTWSFLAAIKGGAAVEDIAERLRIFEFPAAKKVAEFVRRGLLVMVADEPADGEVEATRAPTVAPAVAVTPAPPPPAVTIETTPPPLTPISRIELPPPPELPSYPESLASPGTGPPVAPPPPGSTEIEIRTTPAGEASESDDSAPEAP
jgi:hypothetical protein